MAKTRQKNDTRKRKEITFRGAQLDANRLAALMRRYELTGADVLRRLLKEECERVQAIDKSWLIKA